RIFALRVDRESISRFVIVCCPSDCAYLKFAVPWLTACGRGLLRILPTAGSAMPVTALLAAVTRRRLRPKTSRFWSPDRARCRAAGPLLRTFGRETCRDPTCNRWRPAGGGGR